MKVLINRVDSRIRLFAPEVQKIEYRNSFGLFVEYRIGGQLSGYRFSALDWELRDVEDFTNQVVSEFVNSHYTEWERHNGISKIGTNEIVRLADFREAIQKAYNSGLNVEFHIK